jgi:hypothetical protein
MKGMKGENECEERLPFRPAATMKRKRKRKIR